MKQKNPIIERMRAWVPSRAALEANGSLGMLAPYLSDPKLWHWSRRGVAAGLAIGLFIGLLIPLTQMLFAAAAAAYLRVNVPVAVAGTLVTNPLTVPPIYYAAYHLGAWATGASATDAVSFVEPATIWENFGMIAMPLFAGLGIAATFAAIASYFLVMQVWAWRVAVKRGVSR